MNCIFCQHLREEQILYRSNHFKIVLDIDPIQAGHLLIISQEHVLSIQELTDEALVELISLEQALCQLLEEQFHLLGTTVVRNNGGVMDEGVHFHSHVIPRYERDHFWSQFSPVQHELDTQQLARLLASLKTI